MLIYFMLLKTLLGRACMTTGFTDPLSLAIMNVIDMYPKISFPEETFLTIWTGERSLFPMDLFHMINNALFVPTFVIAKATFESLTTHFCSNDLKEFLSVFILVIITAWVFIVGIYTIEA